MGVLGGPDREAVATSLTVVLILFVFGAILVFPAQAQDEAVGPKTSPFEVKAKGGAELRGHVTLPGGRGPFATILELSP
ncbi:MAG: hypothetical protein M3277_03260, partial [Actinomycetota bacterium]|nr:hypothetical protein [Actinomycetota bacterium]